MDSLMSSSSTSDQIDASVDDITDVGADNTDHGYEADSPVSCLESPPKPSRQHDRDSPSPSGVEKRRSSSVPFESRYKSPDHTNINMASLKTSVDGILKWTGLFPKTNDTTALDLSPEMSPKSYVTPKMRLSPEPLILDLKHATERFPKWMILKYGQDLLTEEDLVRLKTDVNKPSSLKALSVSGSKGKQKEIYSKPHQNKNTTPVQYPDWMVDRYGKDLLDKVAKSKRPKSNTPRHTFVSPSRARQKVYEAIPEKTANRNRKLSDSIKDQRSPDVMYLEECNNGLLHKGKGYLIPDSLSIDGPYSSIDFNKRKGYVLDRSTVQHDDQRFDLVANIERYLDPLTDFQGSDIDFSKRKGYIIDHNKRYASVSKPSIKANNSKCVTRSTPALGHDEVTSGAPAYFPESLPLLNCHGRRTRRSPAMTRGYRCQSEGKPEGRVTFNVGGTVFQTSDATVQRSKNEKFKVKTK